MSTHDEHDRMEFHDCKNSHMAHAIKICLGTPADLVDDRPVDVREPGHLASHWQIGRPDTEELDTPTACDHDPGDVGDLGDDRKLTAIDAPA